MVWVVLVYVLIYVLELGVVSSSSHNFNTLRCATLLSLGLSHTKSRYLPKRKSCGGFRFGSVNSEQTFWMFWTFLDGFDRSKDRNGESKVSSKV